MPGFSINGTNSSLPNNMSEPKFKHRWIFSIPDMNITLPAKKTKRPSIKWNEKPLRRGHETIWFSSDTVWEPISLTLYDLEKNPDTTKELIKFITAQRTGNITTFIKDKLVPTNKYKKDFVLKILDAKGLALEEWILMGAWVQSVNFGELTYAASDILKIELNIRFDRTEIN
jgi:hypothetical protein